MILGGSRLRCGYGLVDHEGKLRYIGSTSSWNETLYKRIHQCHRTGSETSSHYFSRMYNTRIDNGQRFIERILGSVIDIPGSEEAEVGEPVFDDLTYIPGIEKRLAGVVHGQLSHYSGPPSGA